MSNPLASFERSSHSFGAYSGEKNINLINESELYIDDGDFYSHSLSEDWKPKELIVKEENVLVITNITNNTFKSVSDSYASENINLSEKSKSKEFKILEGQEYVSGLNGDEDDESQASFVAFVSTSRREPNHNEIKQKENQASNGQSLAAFHKKKEKSSFSKMQKLIYKTIKSDKNNEKSGILDKEPEAKFEYLFDSSTDSSLKKKNKK